MMRCNRIEGTDLKALSASNRRVNPRVILKAALRLVYVYKQIFALAIEIQEVDEIANKIGS